jgi:hypothetical protein
VGHARAKQQGIESLPVLINNVSFKTFLLRRLKFSRSRGERIYVSKDDAKPDFSQLSGLFRRLERNF